MIGLHRPLNGKRPEDIFIECSSSFCDQKKSSLLLALKDTVAEDSDEYSNAGKRDFSKPHGGFDGTKVQKDALVSVYRDKFAKKGSIGRKYYDEIIQAPEHGRCPICGVGTVSTLDHYLPKSQHPTLAVVPDNLIPSCSDCNKAKGASGSATIHVYFDEIPPNDIWLYAKFSYDCLKQESPLIDFCTRCPSGWCSELVNKVSSHFDTFKLRLLFCGEAAREVAEMKSLWSDLLAETDSMRLMEQLDSMRKSFEKVDLNSWRSALYRALIQDFSSLVDYLNSQQCSC